MIFLQNEKNYCLTFMNQGRCYIYKNIFFGKGCVPCTFFSSTKNVVLKKKLKFKYFVFIAQIYEKICLLSSQKDIISWFM